MDAYVVTRRAKRGALVMVLFACSAVGGEPDREPGPCPEGMVRATDAACIDVYPWPNVEGVRPTLGLSGIPEPQDERAGLVMDATGLCESVGKRVCSLEEWTAACRGPHGAAYPWGDELPPYVPGTGEGICNYDEWFRPYDERLVYERDQDHMDYLDQSEPAGSRAGCVSASGARDMIGLEQWVTCPGVGHYGWCLVGRFWAEPRSCERHIVAHSPKWHWYTTGARCCLSTSD